MNIVILSRNANLYSTRRLIAEGEDRGHDMEVIDPLKCDIIIEKEKPTIYYKDRYLDYVDAIIPRIGSSVTFYGCAVVRQFEMMNVFSTVTSDAIIRSRDKLRSFQRLSKAGIGMPKTVFTNYSRDVEEVLEHVGGTPVIIKLLEGTQGLGVVLAETKNAAESVLEAFNGLQARALVQEYIAEAKGEAEAIAIINKALAENPNYLEWLKTQAWDGKLPLVVGEGGTPFIQIPVSP